MLAALTRALIWAWLVVFVVHANDDNKYFHEPAEDDLHRHYDTRFFKDIVSDEERQITLRAMIRAYLLLFDNFGLETWIAHGTLLGWFWNGENLPWVSCIAVRNFLRYMMLTLPTGLGSRHTSDQCDPEQFSANPQSYLPRVPQRSHEPHPKIPARHQSVVVGKSSR